MANNKLWYTRRDREIRGPFPGGLVTRYILLGRIKENDDLSTDQLSWLKVSELPELIPDEMKVDLSVPENQERLRIARMREDERATSDRRSNNSVADSEDARRRSGIERRRTEDNESLRHREIRDKLLESLRQKEKESYISRFVWLTFVLVVIAYIVVSHP